jgi:group I intron endonuclease
MIGIYKITSPSKKIYIGQSIHIEERFKDYKYKICKQQSKLYSSLKKHGYDKHKFEILQECNLEQLNELEKYYIELFQCFNSKYGLNLREGGGAKGKMSDETKLKIKNIKTGKTQSKESNEKRSLALKGIKRKPRTQEHTDKITCKIKGKKRSENTKQKMSISKLNMSQETKNKMSIFHKNLPDNLRKKHSNIMKKNWNNPEYREMMINAQNKNKYKINKI